MVSVNTEWFLDLFPYFGLVYFYSYSDLAGEPCRASKYRLVDSENLSRNKNRDLGRTRERRISKDMQCLKIESEDHRPRCGTF